MYSVLIGIFIQADFQVITDSYPSRLTIRFAYKEDL